MAATVIEATSKRFKGEQALGCLAIIVGLIGSFVVGNAGNQTVGTVFAAMFLIGIPLYIGARVAAWWHHG
jgi:hypothetical protein